ncbi:MAG TPA: glycerol-3-phosphate 1-O-acyltransferase PlsY [Rhabdaerophilum sp.]|nr:glycerol-3-phosphate 1-O-acyltransferase PlsY [Rhabdaerophilum sp.]
MGEFPLGGMAGVLALAVGYLCGSIPFGLVLTRFAGTVDIREIGSKSIGATNVLRTGRKDLAAATVLLDALKGTVPVLIAMKWGIGPAVLAGIGAFLGHLYPVWLKFAGGKGVATYIGVLLGLWWPGLVIFGAVWLAVAFITRYSSAAALVASVVVPVSSFFLLRGGGWLLPLALSGMAVLLWFRHRANIERLLAGTEGKIGQKG